MEVSSFQRARSQPPVALQQTLAASQKRFYKKSVLLRGQRRSAPGTAVHPRRSEVGMGLTALDIKLH